MRLGVCAASMLALCCGFLQPATAQAQNQWEYQILAYEAADLASPPAKGSVVITGSSTIGLWTTIAADLAPLDVIPRGFGGSTADDLDYYLERIVLAYEPRAVVIYEGDNDVAVGSTPQYIADRMAGILARISARLPGARVYVLSIKPSPARWSQWPISSQANALLAAFCATDARYTFINAAPALLGGDGLPKPEYYQADELHLSTLGYQAWSAAIRPTLHAQQLSPPPPDAVAPTVPSGLVATAMSASRIDLRWSASSDAGIGLAGYRVSRNGTFVANTTATTFADTGLASNTAYTYTVSAYDRAAPNPNESAQSAAASATTPVTSTFALRVNAAGPAYTDVSGNTWIADTGFNTGSVATHATTTPILGTSDPTLYRSERWDAATAPELGYSFTVPNGSYQVRLHFADNCTCTFGVGKRVFSVKVEGSIAIQNLDVFATVGAHAALIRSVTTNVTDGQLNISFVHGTEDPLINAIEVIALAPPPDTQAPAAPGTLTATASGTSQINLAWGAATDNVAVTGYEVERCTGVGCSSFSLVSTVTSLTLNNTGLAAGTSYSYRVRARDAAGNLGPYGAIASATTVALPPPDAQPPSAPGTLTATATGTSQINLTWGAATDNVAVTGYEVERCTDVACNTFFLLSTVTGLALNNTGLTPATSYSYRVRARDAAGNLGPYGTIASTTTDPLPPPDTQAPSAPGTLTASAAGMTQINLAWGAATDNVAVTGYEVERCSGAGCATFTLLSTVTGLALNNTGLTAATSYSYRVRARDAAGNLGPYGAIVPATTDALPPPDTQAPSAPGTLTATAAGTSQVNLAWGAATDNVGVTAYEVERCSGAGCAAFTLLSTVTGLALNNTGLTAATSYSYRVRARDAAGNIGPYGVVASTSTAAAPAFTLRVNAAGPAYTDAAGNSWSADTGFNTGSATTHGASLAIAGTSDPTIYRSERWDASTAPELSYSFTVPNGTYQIRLHFAENCSCAFGVGKRVFSVRVEGTVAILNLDVYAAVGASTALVRTVTAAVIDGQLNISFVHGIEDPFINGIEIIAQPATPDTQAPSAPGALTASAFGSTQVNLAWGAATDNVLVAGYEIERCTGPSCTGFAPLSTVAGLSFSDTGLTASTSYSYRIRARDAAGNVGPYGTSVSATTPATSTFALRVNVAGPAYTDAAGNSWIADTGFNTGSVATYPVSTTIVGTSDPTLYRSERWDGSSAPELAYSFTVPNGNYQVRLHFADNCSCTFGVGKRVFSVKVEGSTLIQNLDIYASVGAHAALVRTVSTAVTDGQLNISFVHVIEDPLVNAIEVVAVP